MAILPGLVLVAILLLLYQFHPGDWRQTALRASAVWGAVLLALTEILSLFRAFTFWPLAWGWFLALAVVSVLFVRRARSWSTGLIWPRPLQAFRAYRANLDRFSSLLILSILFLILVTLLLALIVPVQTWDSLSYHLSRVLHWAQDQGVQLYPTGILRQNAMNPWAEYAVLNLFVLAGSDRLANLVGWLAYGGCILGVSLLARQMGCQRRGQIFAAVFAATLPALLSQASTTMTDIVLAFWVVLFASEVVGLVGAKKEIQVTGESTRPGQDSRPRPGQDSRPMTGLDSRPMPNLDSRPIPGLDSRSMPGLDSRPMPGLDSRPMPGLDSRPMPALINWIFLGLAGGLSLLTKATAFAYLLPFVIWLVITMPGREGLWRALKHMFLAGGIVLALGAGYYTRNTLAYGGPLGPAELLQLHSNQIHTPAVLVSNVVRNVSLHLGTPSQAINDRLKEGIIALHRWLGLDVADPRTTFRGSAYKIPLGPSNREDLAGNPLHLILILVGSLAFALRWRTLNRTGLGWYFLSVLATFLVFSLGNNWQVFGSRLQLSFFVLAAPALGGVVENLWPARTGHVIAGHVMALALIVASLPWVLMIQSRPIIPIPGLTYPQSVLVTPRSDLYFANAGDPQFYAFISQKIATAHCDQVGLLLNGDDAEALWWVSLRAMIPTVRLEWLDSDSRLAKLSSLWYFSALDFKPCAALAATQPGRKTLAGLVLWYENDALQLYLGTGK